MATPAHGRDRIWSALRARHLAGTPPTVRDLVRASRTSTRTVRDYAEALIKAAIVERRTFASEDRAAVRFVIMRDPGAEAPRVRQNGETIPESDRDRMWRTARMLKTFTARDLAVSATLPGAEVSERSARNYAEALARAGLLSVVPNARGARAWRVVGQPGPRTPLVRSTGAVFDPNTGKVAGAYQRQPAHG